VPRARAPTSVRKDHLSLCGYERSTTPYLEARAAESAVYTSAVAEPVALRIGCARSGQLCASDAHALPDAELWIEVATE
jgi:hypothetical protein